MALRLLLSAATLFLLTVLQLSQGQFYDTQDEQLVETLDKRQQMGRLTPQQQRQVVDLHNKLRQGEAASDMQKLVWNDRLARLAQSWADRCVFEHRSSSSYNPKDYGFSYVGENIWASSADVNPIPDAPIKKWFDEKSDYNYATGSCRGVCGHYTAIVWATTTDVGCGFAKCPVIGRVGYRNGVIMVCNYGPGGNMMGEKPYKRGLACSECPSGQGYCTAGLCDKTCSRQGTGGMCDCKIKCQNGGSLTPGCRCQCKGQYIGSTCADLCQDRDRTCGRNDGTGLPEFMCNMAGFSDYVREKCPKMCKLCGQQRQRELSEDEQNTPSEPAVLD